MVDTATFQRLRNLKQLGLAHLTYPNATHARFAHSLGVFAIMSRVLRASEKKLGLTGRTQQDLRLAALLHDVGHYPYSHLMERIDDVELTEALISSGGPNRKKTISHIERYPTHEELGRTIVTTQPDVLKALGGKDEADRVAALFTRSQAADPQQSKLIHSSLDMDRLDYLLRDGRAAGVPYGEIDLSYLLNHLRVSPSGILGIDEKAMAAAEQFLLARYFMQRTVYFHKTTFGFEEAFRHLLRRCRDAHRYGLPLSGREIRDLVQDRAQLLEFTDSYLDRVARQALDDSDPTIKTLAHAIVFRHPPKLLKQVTVLVDDAATDSQRHNACTSFWDDCKHELGPLSRRHGVDLGRFILAEPPPIRLEKRGSLLPVEDSRDQPAHETDELIKVFVRDDPEPKSLVDVTHSIIHKCGGQTLRMTRLYVVHDDADKVARMRSAVHDWDGK